MATSLRSAYRTTTIKALPGTSPAARSKLIAGAARDSLARAQAEHRQASGRVPSHETTVDGRTTTRLESVNPNRGTIAFTFETASDLGEIISWIIEQLEKHSPVRTGRYRSSHQLFADGQEVEAFDPKLEAKRWMVLSPLPYSRKIEALLAVYESVAALADDRFDNRADIYFGFRDSGEVGSRLRGAARRNAQRALRFPAIIIVPR